MARRELGGAKKTSWFFTFVSHHSSAFLQVIRLMVLATQLTAILHA
jgi:hypothetical protein